MVQATVRGIARRAVQAALLAAGIVVLLVLFSRQAHADTTPSSSPASGPGSAGVVQTVGSAASAVTQGAISSGVSSQASPVASGGTHGSQSQNGTPSDAAQPTVAQPTGAHCVSMTA